MSEALQGAEVVDIPKRRGRPPKSAAPEGVIVEGDSTAPGDLPEAVALDTRPKGRRGRPPKSERNLDGIKQLLLSTHIALASIARCPELALEESEASLFANSLSTLADHYKIKLDGKSGAMIGFLYTLGIIYGPRAIAISVRVRNERHGGNNSAS